jgi:hypothetical protein
VPADAEMLEQAVLGQNFMQSYQTAHKMKPTIELFELGVFDELVQVLEWGRPEKIGEDVSMQLAKVLASVHQASAEIKSDFKL